MQRCPECDELISPKAINIREGFALCPACGKLTKLSELRYGSQSVVEILSQPPDGCSIVPVGQSVVVRASLRSIADFLFPAGFALFWNSIVSIFVLVAIAGLYSNLIGPLPAWFPALGMKNGKPEMDGSPMDLGMTLLMCVFLIPFVAIGTGMGALALMYLLGRVEVVVDEFDSYAATGIGILVWKRRFDPLQVQAINFCTSPWQQDGRPNANRLIQLKSNRTIKFGSLLESDRLDWMCFALRELMLKSNTNRTITDLPVLMWIPHHEK